MYLNCHSYYSLLYGTLSPQQLVEKAASHGIGTLALTDINNSAGIPDFVRLCQEKGIKPVAGMEFRQGDSLFFIALAQNPEGFHEINHFQTLIRQQKETLKRQAPEFQHVFVVYPLENLPEKLRKNEFAGIRPAQAGRLLRLKLPPKKPVILQPVTFADETEYYLHQNLRAIAHNLLLSRLAPEMTAHRDEVFLSPQAVGRAFARYPDIVENTNKLLEQCFIHFHFPKNKTSYTGSPKEDIRLLEELAWKGFSKRYGTSHRQAKQRIRHELKVIAQMNFAAYFLITYDIVQYARQNNIPHVGRGSGANSIVAYCLGITDVDPVELDLYFERFINPKRSSPPDFDLDFSWKEREKIQQYIFRRFGKERVALLGATITFKKRSALRELAKVHGLPKEEIDRLTSPSGQEVITDKLTKHLYALAGQLLGFPHERSIHAGGVLISEKPLTYFTALDLPPKGMPTTQWDMYTAETLGFEKLDILSQRGMGHIAEAVELIRKNRGITIDIHKTESFKKDEKARAILREGETIGCFYIESPAMRGLLKKLHCDDYLTLVAASSIIRPGVAQSGMMRTYIERYHHPEKIRYLHPVLREQLSETYGVMVYQEDVLKVCHHFAGLDLSDADMLRRAMSGKYRGKEQFKQIKEKFFENSRQKGHADKIISEVWRQVESFAGYSFSKAHSASYAVESFQSLYLKAHYPLEFMTAVINNFGGFYPSWVYFNEIKRLGGRLHLPCVNHSSLHTNISGKDVFIGFIHIKGLENNIMQKIVMERNKNGRFTGLEDFIRRIEPGYEQITLLIKCGALRFTGKSKPQLLWEALGQKKKMQETPEVIQLFAPAKKAFHLPQFTTSSLENAYDEMELLGFPVSMDPFDMLKTRFRGEIRAKEMPRYTGKQARMLGRLVTLKYVKTQKKELMHFATFMDNRGEMFDATLFPSTLKKFPFRGPGFYLLLGTIEEEFGHTTLQVKKMAKLPLQPDPREE